MKKVRAAVGMSGGVDSSVAAALLVDRGYEVIGVTMNLWDERSGDTFAGRHACFGPNKRDDARKAAEVCRRLGIPFFQFSLAQEFHDEVLEDFSLEYSRGRTPNPCVRCNSRIKFNALLRKAAESGVQFDCFATGHYVQTGYRSPFPGKLLLKGADTGKDQSYFLYRLTPEQLERVIFPLGALTKGQVRNIAREKDLGFRTTRESQDFISGGYADLLNFPSVPGDITDSAGRVLGTHSGFAGYTIGQRRGLGIAAPQPYYVTGIDPENNRVIVGFREEGYSASLQASQMNWLVPLELLEPYPFAAEARIRSSQRPFPVRVIPSGKGIAVDFLTPQWAVTPGQSVVLSIGDAVIGGGIIDGRR
jgi:tRNA-uridine 2-sulfurtransferase